MKLLRVAKALPGVEGPYAAALVKHLEEDLELGRLECRDEG